MQTYMFDAIGTSWIIELYDAVTAHDAAVLERTIHKRIDAFDKVYSRFRPDSLVTEMSRHAGDFMLPDDAAPLLTLYRQLYDLTEGVVTPLIGQTLSDAGYDAAYSLRLKQSLAAVPAWDEVMTYEYPVLRLKRPALLDFGAAGKGYLADLVGQVIERSGCTGYCINAGGDIVYKNTASSSATPGQGKGTLDVALEHPTDPSMAVGVAHLSGGSICGSSGNRRAWSTYHHIIHPSKLVSPQHIQAVWVTAASGLVADGLATALYFASPEAFVEVFAFENAIVTTDGAIQKSDGFPATFYYNVTK